jgi:hypothetical protein
MDTIVAAKNDYSRAALLRETAVRLALAYFAAFLSALLDHVERVTGRRDYDDYTGLVQPDDPVLQQLWRAGSTSKHARELADDVGLMCVLARDPHLVPMAENLAERLLLSRPKL